MNIWRLECFVALADELHFGRAARRLHISQPALSQQVKQFENELGVPLVDRVGSVSLTEAGALLHTEGVQILRSITDVVEAVKSVDSILSGELRVLYGRSLPTELGVQVVREYRELNQSVSISTQTMWTSWNIEALRDGLADVVFVRLPILNEPDIVTMKLGTTEQYLTMSEEHPLAGETSISVENCPELIMVPWVREDAPGAWNVVFGRWNTEKVTFTPAEPDIHHRLEVARQTGAVTPVHDWMIDNLPKGMVALPTEPRLHFEYGIAWRRGTRSRLVRSFIELARKHAE